ncbi:MAG: hypothetical protein MUO27_11085 [Sedimentisphaerales bacterium]|nr:hypothetical protein [Sedimentisphaerales bacterium]
MRSRDRKFGCGFTLTELVITTVIALTLILAVGTLLVGGQRAWQNTYNSAHKKIKQDASTVTISFGCMGRRSNRLYTPLDLAHSGYVLYKVNGGNFTPAVPVTQSPQEVVSGDAVEFRYWNVELDKTDSQNLLDVKKTATAYALFYLDGDKLKVDYGPYPPGAVPAGSGGRNTAGVKTVVLAENASLDKSTGIGAFSHTTLNRVGEGSVRIDIVLTDPDDGETIKVMTSTLMRNIWPR